MFAGRAMTAKPMAVVPQNFWQLQVQTTATSKSLSSALITDPNDNTLVVFVMSTTRAPTSVGIDDKVNPIHGATLVASHADTNGTVTAYCNAYIINGIQNDEYIYVGFSSTTVFCVYAALLPGTKDISFDRYDTSGAGEIALNDLEFAVVAAIDVADASYTVSASGDYLTGSAYSVGVSGKYVRGLAAISNTYDGSRVTLSHNLTSGLGAQSVAILKRQP